VGGDDEFFLSISSFYAYGLSTTGIELGHSCRVGLGIGSSPTWVSLCPAQSELPSLGPAFIIFSRTWARSFTLLVDRVWA